MVGNSRATRWERLTRAGALAISAGGIWLLIAPANAPAAVGELTYEGCLTTEEESGPGPVGTDACVEIANATDFGGVNTGLDNPESVAVSPDGRSLYAVSRLDDALMRFDRDPTTGELDFAYCFTGESESGGACEPIPSASPNGEDSGIDQPEAVTVAPDGKAVYITARFDDAVAAFKRKKTGFISYVGCVSGDSDTGPAGSDACTTAPSATPEGAGSGFDDPKQKEVAISRDGEWLYAASDLDDSVLRFKRDPATAVLDYRGCLTGEEATGPAPGGSGACKAIPEIGTGGANSGLDGPRWVELSRDGRSLFVTSDFDNAVARFKRNPDNGKLSWGECVSGDMESGPAGSDACSLIPTATPGGTGSGLNLPRALAVSRDQLYAAGSNDSSIARFKIKSTGKLAYKSCLSADSDFGPAGTGVCKLTPTANALASDTGLDQIRDLELSADGRFLYAAAQSDSAITTFKREHASGKVSFARCVSGDTDLGAAGTDACDTIPSAIQFGDNSGLGGVETVAVSLDGRSVYGGVEGDDAIARLTRAQG